MGGRILIVDDESPIADTIAYALKTDGFEPLRATTGEEALSIVSSTKINLVLLDIGLPDVDGFSVARSIRRTADIPIIFLTARNDEIDRVVGLELGADDYVTKPFSPRELTARVKAVLRRYSNRTTDHFVNSQAQSNVQDNSQRLGFSIDEERFEIAYAGVALDLSVYEYKIFKVLLRSPGRVYTREHLMSLCWDEPDMSLERTVDAHIKNIRQKLKARGVVQEVIVTHRGLGYSLAEGEL